ncbi:MAG: hypothetical protein ACPG77_21000, partial [Nannocystaceae bacterium]
MKSARIFNRILRKNFHMHAAWMPVVTDFSLGDYGLFRRGIFVPLGNVREFGVDIKKVPGKGAKLDFVSNSASVVHFAGGGQVPGLPSDDTLDAKLELKFSRAKSFILKAGELTSERIGNIAEIAYALSCARRRKGGPRWRIRYKVVGEVFRGENVTIIATRERNTGISFSGQAGALKQFNAGSVDSSLDMALDKQVDMQIRGQAGPVGLGLFRVRVSGLTAVNFGEDNPTPSDANRIDPETGESIDVAEEAAWELEDLEDDELHEDERA